MWAKKKKPERTSFLMRLWARETVGWVCVLTAGWHRFRGVLLWRDHKMKKENHVFPLKTTRWWKRKVNPNVNWDIMKVKKNNGRTFFYLHLIVRLWYHFLCSVRTLSSERSSILKAASLSLKSGFKTTWQWWQASLLGLHYYRWGTMRTM